MLNIMVNFLHLKVLVRADGDISEVEGIQIPGRLARLDEDKPCAYLVDIRDTFSPWALRRSEEREKLYRKQQWEPVTYEEMLNDLGKGAEGRSQGTAG